MLQVAVADRDVEQPPAGGDGVFASAGTEDEDAHLVVWALNRLNASAVATTAASFQDGNSVVHVNPTLTILQPSVRDNPYLAAQSGLFTTVNPAS